MGILEAAQPGSDAWWRNATRKIDELQRDLDELRAAVGSQGAVFSSEGITIRDGGSLTIEDDGDFVIGQDATLKVQSDDPEGEPIAQFGDVLRNGVKVGRGMSIDTSEGLRVATVSEDAETGSVFWEFRDAEQNVVLANDVQSGFGLRYPVMQYSVTDWLPFDVRFGEMLAWPFTESASFGTFGRAEGLPLTHPRMRFRVDGGGTYLDDTTVQYRVIAEIGSESEVLVTSDPVEPYVTWSWDWDVASFSGRGARSAFLRFEMRRASGTDRVYARVRNITGRGSL